MALADSRLRNGTAFLKLYLKPIFKRTEADEHGYRHEQFFVFNNRAGFLN